MDSQFNWLLSGQPNQHFLLQTSTNLADWVTIDTITNLGRDYTFFDHIATNTPRRFYRTIPD